MSENEAPGHRSVGTGLERSTPVSTALASQRAGTMQVAFQGLMPTSIGEAFQLSTHLAKSNAIPKSLRAKPESVLTVILAGMELGLTPIRALQSITNISGNLSMRADLQLGLTRRSGVLSVYDESFEEMGRTDGNLLKRLQLALGGDLEAATITHEKIMAAVQGMPAGKPYAWAMARRVGEDKLHVRTFTWLDAEKAFVYEKDDDGADANEGRSRKKLSEKFNYVSWPGDMYPKRARSRLLQIVAGDVLAGLPAVEQLEGGQVYDAEFTVEAEGHPDVDALLQDIENQELVTSITTGFKQLNMGQAKQLQKLTQYKGKPDQLLDWLKTEWANRKGIPRKQADALSDQPATAPAPAQPVQDAQTIPNEQIAAAVKEEIQAAEARAAAAAAAVQAQPAVAQQPAVTTSAPATPAAQPDPSKDEPVKKGKTAGLAARFKAGTSTF